LIVKDFGKMTKEQGRSKHILQTCLAVAANIFCTTLWS